MKEQIEKQKYRQLTFELQQLIASLEKEQIDTDSPESEWFNIGSIPFFDVEVIYLPNTVQTAFAKFAKNEVKLYKICNYGKSATSIKYNHKHQYSTEKLRIEDLLDWQSALKNRLRKEKESMEKEKANYEKVGLIHPKEEIKDYKKRVKHLIKELNTLKGIFTNFDKYEIVQSSFFKGLHRYSDKKVKHDKNSYINGRSC